MAHFQYNCIFLSSYCLLLLPSKIVIFLSKSIEILFNTEMFLENTTYAIMVTVTKGTRTANVTQTVEIKPGFAPVVEIEWVYCIHATMRTIYNCIIQSRLLICITARSIKTIFSKFGLKITPAIIISNSYPRSHTTRNTNLLLVRIFHLIHHFFVL